MVRPARSVVEDQDARIGENRARDGDALALSAREAHAALADDGVVAELELRDELVAVSDAARLADLLHRGARLRECDVLANGAIEQEIVLQHDAQVRPVLAELERL